MCRLLSWAPREAPCPPLLEYFLLSLPRMLSQLTFPAFSLTPVPFPMLCHLYRNMPIYPTRCGSPVTFSQKLSLTLCPHVLRLGRLPPSFSPLSPIGL